MGFCNILLNSGDDLLLNTGDKVKLNDNTCDGLLIVGNQTTSQVYKKKRPEQLIPIEFTFKLVSHTIPRIILHSLHLEGLKPVSLSSKILREAFVFDRINMKPFIKKLGKRMRIEFLIESVANNDLLTVLKLLRSWRK